ncbi:conserved membrane hypothetical protein [uncultured Desulfobacterium sp.]|uniref:Yip1 domain-containing protein n=1 Tax=uncultured Desulfobacterium sp. TaxID=201089 RepID=A0A445MWN7_9BACT|nr:conserved membrane hypothetical protein [uncultured Desulfobacterium sp.]
MAVALTCPYCSFSKNIPEEKIPPNAKSATCPRCGQRFTLSYKDGMITTEKTTAGEFRQENGQSLKDNPISTGSPWEDRSTLGLWQAIYQTIKAVMFSPDKFFSGLNYNAGFREPLAFGMLTGSIGAMFSIFWQFLMVSGGFMSIGNAFVGQFTFGVLFLITLVFAPILVIAAIFISTAVWHLFLLLLRGADNGFEATFRVVTYSHALQVLGLIPLIGGWISLVWQLIVQIVGLREIHGTSYLKVFFALIIPAAIVFFFVVAVIILVVFFLGRQQVGQMWQ